MSGRPAGESGADAAKSACALSRTARQARILALIQAHQIASQSELSELLTLEGINVSQGTLSKDLLDLGAVRVRSADGGLVYAPPNLEVPTDLVAREAKLAKLCAETLTSIDSSANLVILKTPPGAAQYVASAVDRVSNPAILGTLAGDDTILVITRDPNGGAVLVDYFTQMARAGRPSRRVVE